MKIAIRSTLLLALLFPPCEWCVQPVLAEPAGRGLLFRACVQCHELKSIFSQRKPAAAWRRTVSEMVWRGAPLYADEMETLVEYLAAYFGPDGPAPGPEGRGGAGRASLPDGKGRDLALRGCVQCHDLGVVTSARKGSAEWARTVDDMVRFGAPLGADDAAALREYLTASFGPQAPAREVRE